MTSLLQSDAFVRAPLFVAASGRETLIVRPDAAIALEDSFLWPSHHSSSGGLTRVS